IIAEPRTNSIIAMANAEGAKQLKDLIHKLDVKLVSSSSNRVHVYYLNYGDSDELAKTLSSIVSGATQSGGAGGPGGSTRFTSVGGLGGGSGENPIFSAEVKITSDKNNNALVVTASPTDWLTLKDVIGRLDIPRDQVYVEGLILEANVSKNKAFGVEYVGAYGEGNIQRSGFTTQTSSTNGLLNLLASGIPQSMGGFLAGVGLGPTRDVKVTSGTTTSTVKVNALNAMIKAVASHSSTNILATPQILALDNTEATFEVGDTVQVRNSTIAQGGVQNFNSTPQEAKLSLKITPQINKVTRFVKLKINQKIIQIDNHHREYKFCKKINNISFNQTAFLIKNSLYLIGVDSFCMHLASIYNKKMLILFGGHHYFNCCKPYFGDYKNYRFMIADLKNKKPTFSKIIGSEYMNQFDPNVVAEEFLKHFFENENYFNYCQQSS
ncbi:hypothetical protein EBU94_06370, partial [bacterium]|nr:hypothetical protein [bacterium]